MRRPSKAGGKAVKRQRHRTLKRGNATKVGRKHPAIYAAEKIASLEHSLDEALEQQAATAEVLKVISSSPGDMAPVFEAMLTNAMRLCEAKFGHILLYDGERFHATHLHDVPPAYREYWQKHGPIRPSPKTGLGRIVRDKRMFHIPDLKAEAAYAAREPLRVITVEQAGARSFVGVPMLKDDKLVGAIVVYRQEVRPFTDKQIELLTNFAAQAVIAIENARLVSELRQRTDDLSEALEQQTATADVLRVISSSPGELEAVFQTLLAKAVRLCNAKFGTLNLYDGEIVSIEAVHNVPAIFAEARLHNRFRPHPKGGHAEVIGTKDVVHIEDIRKGQAYREGDPAVVAVSDQGGARTIVLVPMLKDDVLVGTINIYRQDVSPFSEKQIEVVKNFAAQAVIAVENARLLNELRQRTNDLSESLEQQTATSEVLEVISSSPAALDPVFGTMLAKATELCGASYSTLWLHEGDGFRTAAIHGDLPPAWIEQWRSGAIYRPGRGVLLARVIEEHQPIQVADMRTDPSYLQGDPLPVAGVEIAGIRTLLVVPMFKESEPVGAIAIYRKEVLPFTEKQVELVQNFAAQAVIAIENTRLLNELRESLQQQTATADVLKVISRSTFDLQTVLDTLVESAARLCDAEMANIWRPQDGAYRLAASYGVGSRHKEYLENREYLETIAIRPGRGTIVGRTLAEGRTIHVHDVHADSDYELNRVITLGGYRTSLGVPLMREGVPIGVIFLARTRVAPFSQQQIDLVTTFADQAVIAIENVRLFEAEQQRTQELSESLEQQTATSDVLQAISSSTGDLNPVFKSILQNATRICEAKFGVLVLTEGKEFRMAAMHGVPAAFVERRTREPVFTPGPSNNLALATQTRKTQHVVDLRLHRSYAEREPAAVALADAAGARTLVVVPMLKDNMPIGAIAIYRTEVRPFTEKQVELVSNFAAQAVIAIENTRLLNELRQRTDDLSNSLQQQMATADVLKAISRSTFDLQTVLDTLVNSAARLCRAEKANITLLRDGTFHYLANVGFSPALIEHMQSLKLRVQRGSITGRAVFEGKTVHVPDVLSDPEFAYPEAQKLGNFRTALAVPLMREGAAIGTMFLSRERVEPFGKNQIELVETFADQAVIAIANVRLFDEVQARTQELAKSLNDLRTTQDRLVQTQKLASLAQLTAGIAHEIKNPLNFVNNFSGISAELVDELKEALKDSQPNEKRRSEIAELMDTLRSNLDKVVQHGRRADAIVKNMLLHSHQGSGEHRPVAINALVEESLKLAYHGARAEKNNFNVMVEQSFDPDAGAADIFPQEVTRVLLNLISNGVYATGKKTPRDGETYKPTLVASTKDLGDRVEIGIRDNGTGVPPEVKEKMFNPFFTTKPAGEGTGLGLSISHDIIVKQHGGSIEVETEPGEFTEIRIILPRACAFLSERS